MKHETGNTASIITYKNLSPKIHPSAFLCEGVRIIGNVEIGEDCSVWYNSVIRGDVHFIKIGSGCNIQDMSMLHVTNDKYPLILGENISIAHSVSLHGAVLEDSCLVGIGAIVLDNARIGRNALVAAGALVREGQNVPEGTLVAGVPAKIIRDLSDEELLRVSSTASNYKKYVSEYRAGLKQ